MIEGSSIDPKVRDQIAAIACKYNKIMVILDSNHTHDHVLSELMFYAHMTSIDAYCVVFDTIIDDMNIDLLNGRSWGNGNSPKSAVMSFLSTNKNFEIDVSIENKLMLTVAPSGYLKRIY
jgi:cephalosporin hydroxylase